MNEANLKIALILLTITTVTCYYFYFTENMVTGELSRTLSRSLDSHFQTNLTIEKLNIAIQELNGKIKALEEQKKVSDAAVALEKKNCADQIKKKTEACANDVKNACTTTTIKP